MGKVVGKILEFGSLAALAVVTAGVGAGVAAGLSVGESLSFTLGGIATFTGISASTAGALAIAGLSSLASIVGTPKAPTVHGQDEAIKSPTPPRIRAYGRAGIVGPYVFYQTDPTTGVAADVYAVHDNWWAPIDGVEGFYLGDDRVANGSGVLAGLKDGTYTDGKVEIDFRIGARVNSVFTQIAGLFGSWGTTHRGDGCATAMVTWQPVKSANYTKYYPKGQPVLRTIARWSKVYDWRDASQSLTDPLTWKWSENPVLHYVHYQLITKGAQPLTQMVIGGAVNPAWMTELAGILTAKWAKLFSPTLAYWTAAANDCDTTIPITMARTVTLADDSSDSDHTLLVQDTSRLAVGVQITLHALDDIDHVETVTVTSIAGQTIGISPEVQYFYPLGSAVEWQSTTAYPLSEPRYRGCVAHNMTDAHKDTEAAILACFDGWVAPRQDGALVVHGGRYYAPTVSIGPDQIVSCSRDDGVDDENAVNELVLTYISAEHGYNPVDCTPWDDADDQEARGRIASQTLQNQVPSYTQARRLAKRAYANIMAPYRGTVTTNATGRAVVGERYINLTIIRGGVTWFDGPAEISQLTYNLQTGGVTFQWVAADPNIDAWDPATEEGLPAPIGNVVAAEPVATPSILSAIFFDNEMISSGTPGARIRITAQGPSTRDDLTWFARWRVVGSVSWNEQTYSDVDAGASVVLETGFVPVSTSVEVEIAYSVGDGRTSAYSSPPFTVATGSLTADDASDTADTTNITADRT